jgi:hypothetical protein
MMNFKCLIQASLLSLLTLVSIAQEVILSPPERLSFCEQQSLQFITSATTTAPTQGELSIQFPCGMVYVQGSVLGLEFKKMDDMGRAVFDLSTINEGDQLEVQLSVMISCNARACIDNAELFYLTLGVMQVSEQKEILSDPFNVETGNLVIVRVDTLLMNAALHQKLTRGITVRNTRLRRIASFRFTDEYSDQLQIAQQIGWPITNQPGLRVLELRSKQFRQVGNRDGFLDFGEEVLIKQTIRITSFAYEGSFARSRWSVEWSCGGETCGIAQMQGHVNIWKLNDSEDVLSYIPTRRETTCYYGGGSPKL